MRTPSALDAATYTGVVLAGLGLIVLARWAHRRGARWESFVALRVGDVLFTEVLGAFLIGFGLGSLVAPQLERGGVGGPPGAGGFGGRFGGFGGDRLPFTLGLVAALIAALGRIDVRDLLFRGPQARDTLATYIGWDARVVRRIPAGGFGEIALRDASGNFRSIVATAETDIATGSAVRVIGTKDLNLVVAAA